jgi:hypothetical protein
MKVVFAPYVANGAQSIYLLLKRCGFALDVVIEMQEQDFSVQCQCIIFQLYVYVYLFCNV